MASNSAIAMHSMGIQPFVLRSIARLIGVLMRQPRQGCKASGRRGRLEARASSLPRMTVAPFTARPATRAAILLDRGTGNVAIGAIDAAVAELRLEHSAATAAVVEILAGVGGHGLGRPVAALWTGQGGGRFDHGGYPRMFRIR